MVVHLNEVEQKLATYVGRARLQFNNENNIADQKVSDLSQEQAHLEGAASEIAFCKLMNVYPDLAIGSKAPQDALLLGRWVDVKTTKRQSGRLIAYAGRTNKPADVYALMVGEFPRYRFAGLISSAQLFRPERITDLGYGDTYAANQSELSSVKQWLNEYNEHEARE